MIRQAVALGTVIALTALPGHASGGASPAAGVRATGARPAAGAYLFDDEFSGTRLNTSKWQPNWLGTGGPVSEENNCYTPSQVSVSGGSLHLTAIKKVRGCRDHPYVSGLVNTNHTFHFTTGHLEARVFLPAASSNRLANWPAVWTDGYGTWPATGESDITEGIDGQACWAYHGPRESDGSTGCPSGKFSGWHVYAETVTRTSTTYYYDGHKVGSSANVNAPQYLVLDFAVPYSGPVKVPSEMLVDYIRVSAA